MVKVAQLARALDCGSRGRGFESPLSPFLKNRIVNCFYGAFKVAERSGSQMICYFLFTIDYWKGNLDSNSVIVNLLMPAFLGK